MPTAEVTTARRRHSTPRSTYRHGCKKCNWKSETKSEGNGLRLYADSSDAWIANEEYPVLRNQRSNGYGNCILRVNATSSKQKT
jgi:hypothetical protein